MEPLATAKRVLIWLCVIRPTDEFSSKWKTIVRFAIPLMLFISCMCIVTAYLAFILKNVFSHFEDCIYTFGLLITFITMVYTMIIAFYYRHRVPAIFENLTTIYDTSELTTHEIKNLVQ